MTRAATGDDRPKQFCTLINHETLLASTRRRVDQAIPKERTILLLTEQHRPYFPNDLSELQPHRALLQPLNRGTAPAITWGLSQISALDTKAVVAIFPSDHHIADERRFVDFVLTALRALESGVHQFVRLGISPDSAEPDYGWIEPDFADGSRAYPIAPVRKFWEKPSPEPTLELLARGCLWNSFVIIGEVASLIDLVHQTVAPLRVPFFPVQNGCDPSLATSYRQRIYQELPNLGFSEEVLAVQANVFSVIRVDGVGWTDLGDPRRLERARSSASNI